MMFEGLLASVGSEAVWQVVGTGFALIVALGTAVSVIQRREGSPWPSLLGPALAAATIIGIGWLALVGQPGERAVVTFAVGSLLGPLTFGPVAAAALGALAFAGARWPPVRSLLAPAALASGLLIAGLVIAGGLRSGYPIFGAFRAVAYLGVGALVATAFSGGRPGIGLAAGALLPLVIAVGERSERGLVNLLIALQADRVSPEKWPAAVARMVEIVEPQWIASLMALGAASLFAGLALLAEPRRTGRSALAVLVALALSWGVLLDSDLGPERFREIRISPGASASGGSPR